MRIRERQPAGAAERGIRKPEGMADSIPSATSP